MKRFDIRNKKSGHITHSYKALSPMQPQSEWGLLERVKPEMQCSEEEKLEGERIESVDEMTGEVRVSYRLPQTYEVIETDITAEIDAEKTKREELRAKIKNVKAATTVAALRGTLEALIEHLGLDK